MLSAARNYTDSEDVQAVIAVHGRMVLEALDAADELARKGIKAGIKIVKCSRIFKVNAKKVCI